MTPLIIDKCYLKEIQFENGNDRKRFIEIVYFM